MHVIATVSCKLAIIPFPMCKSSMEEAPFIQLTVVPPLKHYRSQ